MPQRQEETFSIRAHSKLVTGFTSCNGSSKNTKMWLFLLIPRCWRGSPQRKLWKTGLHLSWTPWNTETGWDETDECAVWRGEHNWTVCFTQEDSAVVLMRRFCRLHPRHGCGCSWWRNWGREWSWRRCRSSPSTRYPPSSASRPLRCWCRTYALATFSCAKSWWEMRLPSHRPLHTIGSNAVELFMSTL